MHLRHSSTIMGAALHVTLKLDAFGSATPSILPPLLAGDADLLCRLTAWALRVNRPILGAVSWCGPSAPEALPMTGDSVR